MNSLRTLISIYAFTLKPYSQFPSTIFSSLKQGLGVVIGKDEQETTTKIKNEANHILSRLLHHMEDEDIKRNRLEPIFRNFEQPREIRCIIWEKGCFAWSHTKDDQTNIGGPTRSRDRLGIQSTLTVLRSDSNRGARCSFNFFQPCSFVLLFSFFTYATGLGDEVSPERQAYFLKRSSLTI